LTNPLVKAILVMDIDGPRIFAKYYDLVQFPDIKTQMEFENVLKNKSVKVSTRVDGKSFLPFWRKKLKFLSFQLKF
jgi:hypothetical protein